MSNVIVDKTKIDILANAISVKSGEAVTMTLAEMVEAVDSIEGNPAPILQTVTKTYTPTTSQQTDTITPSSGYDGIGEVDVTVSAVPYAVIESGFIASYSTESGARKWQPLAYNDVDVSGYIDTNFNVVGTKYDAIPTGTSVTPTESSQTIGGANYMLEGSVTVNAIPSNYIGSGITQRSSLDLTANGATVTAPAGYYSSAATKTVASGTEGTPTASKGSVSNHAVTVTPSVTNSAGYISGSTKTGTGVSVSASELVSGNLPITQNGTGIDVTNYATVSVSVSGGGSSGMQIATKTATPSSASASISFTGLSGEPTSFVVTSDSELATGASPYKTASVVFDGTNVIGQYISNTSNAQVTYDSSGFSKSYSNGTLTITGTNSNFQANQYTLVYTYGGSSANLGTSDVQVGSGATSITFTGLEDEPDYFSVAFKSNFGTSSGYQRVITVVYDGTSTYGLEMDSSAKYSNSHWSYTYNNGSLVISSSGTNAGGYFHQPGYYQLTYGVGGEAPELEAEPLSVTQNGTYTAPRGKAYTPVTVNVSGSSSATVGTGSATLSTAGNSISFTNLSGTPKAWFIRCTTQMSSGSTTYYYVVDARYNGTNTQATLFRQGSTRRTQNQTTGFSYTYSGTTLTITSTATAATATPGYFYNGTYELTYVY